MKLEKVRAGLNELVERIGKLKASLMDMLNDPDAGHDLLRQVGSRLLKGLPDHSGQAVEEEEDE